MACGGREFKFSESHFKEFHFKIPFQKSLGLLYLCISIFH